MAANLQTLQNEEKLFEIFFFIFFVSSYAPQCSCLTIVYFPLLLSCLCDQKQPYF